MRTFSPALRRQLEKTVSDARDTAETGAQILRQGHQS